MTVIRNEKKEFSAPLDRAINTVRKVLSEKQSSYIYTKTIEGTDGTSFSTVIKPNLYPLLLSTQLFIEITKIADNISAVEVKTKSQWFIIGDIFNYYNKYIHEFFKKIEDEIKNS